MILNAIVFKMCACISRGVIANKDTIGLEQLHTYTYVAINHYINIIQYILSYAGKVVSFEIYVLIATCFVMPNL